MLDGQGVGGLKTLEEMVDGDETVLFRAPCSPAPGDSLYGLLGLAILIGLMALTGLLSFDRLGLATLALILAGYVPVLAWLFCNNRSCEGLVTERRLLYRSGFIRPKLTEVHAVDVGRIKASEDRIRIFTQVGTLLDLNHPTDAWGLGVALAYAAGIAPPHLATRKALLAEIVHANVGIAMTIAMASLPVTWLVKTMTGGVALLAALGLGATGAFVGLLCLLPGFYIGGLLTLLLLRPFFSHREVTDWLGASSLFWPVEGEAKEIGWEGKLLRRLARILYRR